MFAVPFHSVQNLVTSIYFSLLYVFKLGIILNE